MHTASLTFRFLLELAAIALLAAWGFTLDTEWSVRVVVGLGVPFAAAVLWGTLVAPKARHRLSDPAKLLLELVIFGGATATLGWPGWAGFAGLVALSEVLTFALGQRAS